MKFRKKPIEVEAFQVTAKLLMDFPIYAKVKDREVWNQGSYVLVKTLEGDMRAEIGDWIITGVNGEVYPCKPDIFEKTYEKVE